MSREIFFSGVVCLLSTLMLSCEKQAQQLPSSPVLPVVNTLAVKVFGTSVATSGGNISEDGGAEITERGVCWSTKNKVTVGGACTKDGAGKGIFSSSITGLKPNTRYYLRAYAQNSAGTAYGQLLSFRTSDTGQLLTDTDGNTYATVTIGDQLWMKENLKVSHYRNGDSISSARYGWNEPRHTGGMVLYENLEENNTIYGKLYNWYAVTDARGLCPAGWHVPTDHDWNLLLHYLNEGSDTSCISCYTGTAGRSLKTSGTLKEGNGLWKEGNEFSDNESNFSAIPGGYYTFANEFWGKSEYGYWWTVDSFDNTRSYSRSLAYFSNGLGRGINEKSWGFSVRCLKD